MRGERRAAAGAAEEFFGTTAAHDLPVGIRTYEIEARTDADRQPAEGAARTYPVVSDRARHARQGKVLEPVDDSVIVQTGDASTISVTGRASLPAASHIGPEVYDGVAADVGAADRRLRRQQARSCRAHARRARAEDAGHGLYLNAMFRGGDAIPFRTRDRGGARATCCASPEAGGGIKHSRRRRASVDSPQHRDGHRDARARPRARGAPRSHHDSDRRRQVTLGAAVGLLLVGIALSTCERDIRASADRIPSRRGS